MLKHTTWNFTEVTDQFYESIWSVRLNGGARESNLINKVQGKGKGHPITGHEGPEVEYRYSSTLSSNSALDGGVGGQRHAPAALPPRKTGYPLYRRLGGSRGWSWQVRKISPLPGFDPRTVQPVASRYIDWAIAAHIPDKQRNRKWRKRKRERQPCPWVNLDCTYQNKSRVLV